MAGLDLSGVQRAVEGWLTDTLVLERDERTDAVLDDDTGLMAPAPPRLVWTGLGAVQVIGREQLDDPTTADVVRREGATHRALIPLAADVSAAPGDILTTTAQGPTSHDPDLVGTTFRVIETGGVTSFAVLRFLFLKTDPSRG